MKKQNPLLYLLAFSLPTFINSCATLDQNSIKRINYGTSFGMCIGYCKHDIELTKNTITSNCGGWNNSVTPTSETEDLESINWDDLKVKIDSTTFFDIEKVIGCPDCADGGAEWIEIELINGKKHKVTYEFSKEPEELNEIVSKLRQLFNKYSCI
jgi:hypothetical protein